MWKSQAGLRSVGLVLITAKKNSWRAKRKGNWNEKKGNSAWNHSKDRTSMNDGSLMKAIANC